MALRPDPNGKWTPLWVLGGMMAVLAVARAVGHWSLPLPRCTMRSLTGWPCPFCGSTRVLIEVSHFDLWAAFLLNPLTFTLGSALLIGTILWTFERFTGRPVVHSVGEKMQSKWLAWLALGLLAANWVYLILYLPP